MGVVSVRDGVSMCRMFIAPSHVSVNLASEISRMVEEKLFEVAADHNVNAFLKKVVRRNGEYRAVVVVESEDRGLSEKVISGVESKTVKLGLNIIDLLKKELREFDTGR